MSKKEHPQHEREEDLQEMNHGSQGQDSLTEHLEGTVEETMEEEMEETVEEVRQQQEVEGTRKEGAMERS